MQNIICFPLGWIYIHHPPYSIMTKYVVYWTVGKKRVHIDGWRGLVHARAFIVGATKIGHTADSLQDHPVYVKKEGANDKDWVGKVEYYPGEGLVWCARGKYAFDYYPIRDDGTLGKKHPF